MAGVLAPPPGKLHFHLMLLSSDHLTGRFVSMLTLSPVGPRHCGQFAGLTVLATTSETDIAIPPHEKTRLMK
jgi:hypothetical protein